MGIAAKINDFVSVRLMGHGKDMYFGDETFASWVSDFPEHLYVGNSDRIYSHLKGTNIWATDKYRHVQTTDKYRPTSTDNLVNILVFNTVTVEHRLPDIGDHLGYIGPGAMTRPRQRQPAVIRIRDNWRMENRSICQYSLEKFSPESGDCTYAGVTKAPAAFEAMATKITSLGETFVFHSGQTVCGTHMYRNPQSKP